MAADLANAGNEVGGFLSGIVNPLFGSQATTTTTSGSPASSTGSSKTVTTVVVVFVAIVLVVGAFIAFKKLKS